MARRKTRWSIPVAPGIASSAGSEVKGFDTARIRLLNWNIQKNKKQHWSEDFKSRIGEMDLVLVQEASLRQDSINDIDASRHWSFAPGYTVDGEVTGVMTLSRFMPLTQCSFVTLEPILRTPKATSITEYALNDSDQTLVVVNIHAVNFSWGTGAFQQQFEQIRDVLRDHEGPVILSGDFNTWRKHRVGHRRRDCRLTGSHFSELWHRRCRRQTNPGVWPGHRSYLRPWLVRAGF